MIHERIAIMAVDPGVTTGMARAYLNLSRAKSTRGLLRRAVEKEALRVDQITGTYDEQAHALYGFWTRLRYAANVEMGLPIEAVYLVVEDFQLRKRSADLAPVEVRAGLVTLLRGTDTDVRLQQPSTAMTYATAARLRDWGVWTVGAEHGRDATRHLCLLASKALDGEL